jgi:hypothetical protein
MSATASRLLVATATYKPGGYSRPLCVQRLLVACGPGQPERPTKKSVRGLRIDV